MKEIIILGGGFAGVSAALHLSKTLNKNEANITIIDKNSYHLFHASLYEVATKEEPNKNIAIPFSEIFKDQVRVIKGIVDKLDSSSHFIYLKDGTSFHFDYLVIALGSETSYFGVKGLMENSIPLKNLENAVMIRETIEDVYHKKAKSGKQFTVVVGGGGFSGTELTAELINYRKMLAVHHNLSENLMKIKIIQGSPMLLSELDDSVSKIAESRLRKFEVEISFGAHIVGVDKNTIQTDDGKKHGYDVLIWTGGVKANSVLENFGLKLNGKGQVGVNEDMQVGGSSYIYACGDIAEFADPISNKPVPNVAEVAWDQGLTASENLVRSIRNQKLIPYRFKHLGYIVPIKGHFAVVELNRFRFSGFMGFMFQQFVFLNYLLKILPFTKAFKRWNKFEMYLMQR